MGSLYYGDNPAVLRDHVADESIDLIYLDPAFNSDATYNILFTTPGRQGRRRQHQGLRRHLELGTGGSGGLARDS